MEMDDHRAAVGLIVAAVDPDRDLLTVLRDDAVLGPDALGQATRHAHSELAVAGESLLHLQDLLGGHGRDGAAGCVLENPGQ